MDRVLIFTPRIRVFGRALAATYDMIRNYGNPVEWLQIMHDQPFGDHGPGQIGNLNILHNYEIARRRVLAGDYTHLLTLEDDMVPPPNAINDLLSIQADVAYSLYVWRGAGNHPWSAYKKVTEAGGESFSDVEPERVERLASEDAVIRVAGVGLGCTLIRRHVIEKIAFRIGGPAANDWYFAMDCGEAGLDQRCHLGVKVGHISTTPSLRVIWPDAQAPAQSRRLYKDELL